MISPPLLRRPPAAAEPLGDLAAPPVLDERAPRDREAAGRLMPRLLARLRRDDVLAQFARFVLVGGVTTVVYALFFVTLGQAAGLDYLAAHLSATVASTALANELHRRLTFRAEDRVGWFAAQWEAGGVTAVGLVATSSALSWLDSAAGTAHPALQVAVVVTVTAVIGALRFIALRWIFRPHESA